MLSRWTAMVATLVVAVVAWSASAEAASVTQIDLSGLANSDMRNDYTNGTKYPMGGTIVSVGGIDLKLSTYNGGSLGVIGGTNTTNGNFSIAANVAGAKTVYAIINSAWGSSGTALGSLTFNGSNNDTYVYSLTEGVNVRDHYNGAYVNTVSASNLYGTLNYDGGVRFDVWQIALPASFANETLTSIVFTVAGQSQSGNPLLAAVSVSSVPVPAALPLFATGIVALGALARRRMRKMRA